MPAATLLRGAIDAPTAQALLAIVDAHPAWRSRRGEGFDPHSSSLRLDALTGIDAARLARQIGRGDAGECWSDGVGDRPALAIERSWIRRQYAPANAPERHAAHAWHQDGALCFDFLAEGRRRGQGDLLAMRTCWIALTPCGDDAPGLALCTTTYDRLLELDELADEASAATNLWTPSMRAGDALVFDGSVLHRTHVAPSMRSDRTSLELRVVDAARLPHRLRGDRFISLH